MSTLADAPLSTLTAELAQFLHLPEELDLPRLAAVHLDRSAHEAGWRVRAQLHPSSDFMATYEAVRAWSCTTGEAVQFSEPVTGTHLGTATWKKVFAVVSFVGVEVEVWGQVDGEFVAPSDALAAALLLESAGAGIDGAS